jgi:hypothetical protein
MMWLSGGKYNIDDDALIRALVAYGAILVAAGYDIQYYTILVGVFIQSTVHRKRQKPE